MASLTNQRQPKARRDRPLGRGFQVALTAKSTGNRRFVGSPLFGCGSFFLVPKMEPWKMETWTPAVPWWFNFDPHPVESVTFQRTLFRLLSRETNAACRIPIWAN